MSSNFEIIPDTVLQIRISNNRPIELFDLTKSLISLSAQFSSYTKKYANNKEDKEAKLYIKEVKSGSVILELIELSSIGIIPFIENTNQIFEFTKYCKNVFDHFLKNEGEKPDLTTTDYKEFSSIINPVAKDNGSQINMSTTINGNVSLSITLDSTETNALQNIFKKEIESKKTQEQLNDTHKSVLLTFFQARNDIKSEIGNKGVVEEISDKRLNIVFENEELKQKILHSEQNPLTTAYIVDVKILTIDKKEFAYKILELRDCFEANEKESQNE